jgi:hypothetical protein
MGDIQRALNQPADALRSWRESLSAGEALIERFSQDAPTLSYVTRAAMRLAREGGNDAVSVARKALGYAQRATSAPSPIHQYRLTQARGDAALVLAGSGDASLQAEARALAEQSALEMEKIPATHLKFEWPQADRDRVRALAQRSSN